MEFCRQEWSGWSFPTPGDLPGLEIKPASPVSPILLVDSLPAEPSGNAFKTGTTQRDGMGREEGGGFRMGNTCIPVADSF